MTWLWLSRNVGALLTFGITLPIWLLIAAVVWFHFDKTSAVRHAVDRALTQLVHSAELEAAQARAEGLAKIVERMREQGERDRLAYQRFAELLATAEHRNGVLIDEIADMEAMPAPDSCTVDGALLDRLRISR